VGLDVPFEEREKLVETKPRMATLNPCSMSFADGEFRNPPKGVRRLAARMRELGVKPELEIYDTGHLDVCMELLREDLLEEPLQFSIVLGVRGGMAATPDNLVHLVGRELDVIFELARPRERGRGQRAGPHRQILRGQQVHSPAWPERRCDVLRRAHLPSKD
jgi:uncharacterized protein (DUF849 family)